MNRRVWLQRLRELQQAVLRQVLDSRGREDLHEVESETGADTLYRIDTAVEPIVDRFCREWAEDDPLVLVCEGIEDPGQCPGTRSYTPAGKRPSVRVILDPIDGTRGLMYDKRSAWSIGGVAPEKGESTRLRDLEVACMTELPTSKARAHDVLFALRGEGTTGLRIDTGTGRSTPLRPRPSSAISIEHGFCSVSSFFPGTHAQAAALMEHIARHLLPEAQVGKGNVFNDQYISTAGQWYELIVGHDRFNCDLRPAFFAMQSASTGMCCHPYDCSALLIADEAGVILTDETGRPLDAPLDVSTGINWVGYANRAIQEQIEPLIRLFLGAPASWADRDVGYP
jgi:fructose-1,6-bisphosphatase/inositol monophosphatase family enzyme